MDPEDEYAEAEDDFIAPDLNEDLVEPPDNEPYEELEDEVATQRAIVKNITSNIIAKTLKNREAENLYVRQEGNLLIAPSTSSSRFATLSSTLAPIPEDDIYGKALAKSLNDDFKRVFRSIYPSNSDSILEVEVTNMSTSYPACKHYVPSEDDLTDTRQLPDNWAFNTGFRHPKCLSHEAISYNGTNTCSKKGRWTECAYYEPASPQLLKECKLNDNEAVYLGRVFNQNNELVPVVLKKNAKEYVIQCMGETSEDASVTEFWNEVVDSYKAPVTDVNAVENFSYLAGIIA